MQRENETIGSGRIGLWALTFARFRDVNGRGVRFPLLADNALMCAIAATWGRQ